MACLDTDVLIDLVSHRNAPAGRAAAALRALSENGEWLCTTRVNIAELLVGAHRSADLLTELGRIQRAVGRLTVLDFNATAAFRFAQVLAGLLDRGTPIGDMDVLIASIALCHDEPIVTGNVRHFSAVPGLRVIPYR